MARQRLYRQATGTVDVKGHVQITFEQVPQGSAWTGSVSLYSPPIVSGFPSSLTNGPLQGSTWWLLRNQSPILQMAGSASAVDVQCVGQETLSITGYGLSSGDTVMAVWSGWADDLADAVFVEPHPYGVTAPYMQVYNVGAGPTGPLQVTEVPDPTRKLELVTGFAATGGAVVQMFSPGIGASGAEILSLTLQVTTAQSASTAQAVPFLATLRLNNGVEQDNLMAGETIIVQASQQSVTTVQEFHQYPIATNQTLELVTGALSGTNLARVNASALLSVIPLAP